jgi:hypothetical protein
MAGNPDLEKYRLAVSAALRTILGDSGAKAILFYVGEPSPDTFEAKLRSILGNGAPIIIQELKRRTEADGGHPKHHWLGGHG